MELKLSPAAPHTEILILCTLRRGLRGHCHRFIDYPWVTLTIHTVQIVEVSAGGAHSAAITALGRLYTWGKGRYGRLGHGDYDDQLKPKMVEALKSYKVIQVCQNSLKID